MKKKIFALAVGLLLSAVSMAQTVKVESSDYASAVYTFVAPQPSFSTQDVQQSGYTVVSMPGTTPSTQLGAPNLPIFTEMIELPLCGGVSVRVVDVQTKTLAEAKYPLMPVQPAPSKADKTARPFVMDTALYVANAFYAHDAAWVETMGVARDRNVAMLRISPLSYNPVTGAMSLITSMKVVVTYNNVDISGTQQMRDRYFSPDFSLGHSLLSTLPGRKSVRNAAPLHYLIVAHSSFRGALDEFVAWKQRQGFLVTVAYTDDPEVGTTSNSIAAYTKSMYDNATDELPAPTFLLLVGDEQQIPAFNARCGNPATDHVTDLYYATWTVGDNIPDCYYGRFSARNIGELTPQIEKTIYYERYDFADDDYLGKGILIAGVDRGSTGDNAYTYADPAMDYIAKTYINAGNRFTDLRYYKNNYNFAPAGVTVSGSSQTRATISALRDLYNEGFGWINYSAHGYDDEWSTPGFNTTDVSRMTNNGKPSVMVGNCCLSGRFNTSYDACLGEALLRKAGKAGAVAYFGGTNSTYWPHDFCWAVGVRSNFSNTMNPDYDAYHLGMYDKLFHTHGEAYSNWHVTAGSMVTAGNTAVEQYGSYALYYWEIYELFGDPSLMPWLGAATDMVVDASPVVPCPAAEYSMTVAPHAYVALTTADEHELLCATYADENGSAVLTLPDSFVPGVYELAVWAQNYKPYFMEVNAVVLDGPYCRVVDMQPTDGVLKPGQVQAFDMVLTNMGTGIPTVGLVSVQSTSEGIVPVQSVAHFERLDPGDTIFIANALSMYLPADMHDGEQITVAVAVDYGGEAPSVCRRRYTVSAPRLTVSDRAIAPALTPGGSVSISCRVANEGSDTTADLSFSLLNEYGMVAQQADAVNVGRLAPGEARTLAFALTMNTGIPDALIPFSLYATADGESQLIDVMSFSSGSNLMVDFEDGNIPANWTQNTYPWTITTSDTYAGSYCVRSKQGLDDRRVSEMTLNWTSDIDDSISFYYRVSSEADYDFFKFYIDGASVMEASGQVDWTRAAFAVPAGAHTFAFSYIKDYSRADGSDLAAVDNITLPFVGTVCNYLTDTICQNEPYEFAGQSVATNEAGVVVVLDTTTEVRNYLALHVMESPQVSIEVVGNVALGECVLLKAHGATHYVWSTGDSTDCIAVCPAEHSHYSVTGYRAGCSNEASTVLLGIDNVDSPTTVSLYPNPAADRVTVSADRIRSVEVVSLMGQVLQHREANGNMVTLDIQNLSTGIYFVRVEMPDCVVVKKLVRK